MSWFTLSIWSLLCCRTSNAHSWICCRDKLIISLLRIFFSFFVFFSRSFHFFVERFATLAKESLSLYTIIFFCLFVHIFVFFYRSDSLSKNNWQTNRRLGKKIARHTGERRKKHNNERLAAAHLSLWIVGGIMEITLRKQTTPENIFSWNSFRSFFFLCRSIFSNQIRSTGKWHILRRCWCFFSISLEKWR